MGATRRPDRGQVQPLVAIVAVVAVCLGLGLYAGAVDDHLHEDGRSVAPATLEAVEDAVAPAGVARPDRIGAGRASGPSGYATNVTIATGGDRWTEGPRPAATARRAGTRIAVRRGPTDVAPGRIEVRVW